jgi:hypothetical protein
MRKTCSILTGTALALACAAALHAQTPTSQQSNRSTPATVTLTGCVERADEVAGSGTAAATVDSLSFVLIRAEAPDAATTPKGTSGTNATEPISDHNTYRLSADVKSLNPHVGHKVEITGSVIAPAMSANAADSSPASHAPTLKVDNLKMISPTCDR